MVKAVIQQLQQDVANHLTKLIEERLCFMRYSRVGNALDLS